MLPLVLLTVPALSMVIAPLCEAISPALDTPTPVSVAINEILFAYMPPKAETSIPILGFAPMAVVVPITSPAEFTRLFPATTLRR